jgi:adenosylcobinamide-GDP ribazoletransferase
MQNFLSALALLTVLPVPAHQTSALGKALAYFPFVGAVLGAILAAALYFSRAIFPDPVPAALTLALWAILTGALHLEAVADAGDGLLSAVSRERRLEIMHDPRVGAFGVVAVVLVLLIKFSELASLHNYFFLVLAPILGRWAMVFAATFPLARADGMAARFRAGFGRREIFISTLFAAVAAGALGWRGLVAWVAAVLVAFVIARFALTRLGGLTGDVYGAIGEWVETVVLLVAIA